MFTLWILILVSQLIGWVGVLLWIRTCSKRIDQVEMIIVREVMEVSPKNIEKILETAKEIKDLQGSDVIGITVKGALKEAKRLHGFPG